MEYYISGQITFDDYIKFYKAQKKIKRLFWLICQISIFLFITFSSVSIFSFFDAISFLLGIFGIFGILFNLFNRFICKMFYDSTGLSKNIQNIKIEKDYILIEVGKFKSSIKISNFKKIIRDKDSIYIISKEKLGYLKVGYIIKKRFIENENDFEKIFEYIKMNFGKR